MKVLVIGGGTGGLALAHGLKRAGIEVSVYERDALRTEGLHGYRVGIDPDGSRALHGLLPKELYDTFVATKARDPKYFNMLTENFKEVLSMQVEPSTDPIESEKSISRMTLRQVLLTGLEDVVEFGREFTRFEQHGDRVTAHFADGTQATGDLLVAADGAHSRVRRQYLPHADIEETGIIAIAGKLPITAESAKLVPPKVFEGISMINAPRGLFCILHVMEFQWDRDGRVKHGIGGNTEELIRRWPGLQFDNTRDYINWGVSATRDKLPANVMELRGEELVKLTLDLTPDWHPDLRRLFELTDPGTCFPVNIWTSAPVEPWPTTNVTLIGDAIHTMTPGRGVGANTALRDAVNLCRALIDVRDGKRELIPAVNAYEAKMIEYGFDAVFKSRAQMTSDDPMHKPVIGRIALAVMRTGMRAVNHLPPVKRRMRDSMLAYRGANRDELTLEITPAQAQR
ncbi:FAD-dependent oxidoreductase [Kribbella solani]|uniref:2-polyprenyl-6-methoxyphenol hydroxylase-like FAD-dependent oxidoreductase n=1 Tax=Kribbella solani TaxID=236067 RepID=A0A841DSK7_9ACTN|nr:NAD(P)/FAD-dependent oxidoreductase [Kribbella solani]MBB5979746.1 2-polyprenyl-6-methoxyphenol hydroxylase-like FAD-dependent oxidoreductase [Kribbella solani]